MRPQNTTSKAILAALKFLDENTTIEEAVLKSGNTVTYTGLYQAATKRDIPFRRKCRGAKAAKAPPGAVDRLFELHKQGIPSGKIPYYLADEGMSVSASWVYQTLLRAGISSRRKAKPKVEQVVSELEELLVNVKSELDLDKLHRYVNTLKQELQTNGQPANRLPEATS